MHTPICDFVRDYCSQSPVRLHMPGHKGQLQLGMEMLDITEISGADVLYHAEGIIRQSEDNAASLFGTKRTFYSTEGSSLPIRAMLYLVQLYAASLGKKPRIAAGRNAHKVFIMTAALLDLDVSWIYPEKNGNLLSCEITPAGLDAFLRASEELPSAVYITSPDYLGNVADVAGLSAVCRRNGCLLLVDNAHGAYLNFLAENRHPMSLGADMCCDSAHKTLPVLTGGAYLHISKDAPELFAQTAEQALALFASTSPSYLIMQSLDAVNPRLAGDWKARLHQAVRKWGAVRETLCSMGFCLTEQEPLKLTILPKNYGYTGDELASRLEQENIYCEFSDPDHLVLMLPVEYAEALPERIEQVFREIPRRAPVADLPPVLQPGCMVLSPHAALFLPSETVDVRDALGRVMADPTVSCPPAIPVVCSGEQIDAWAVAAMEYYGITRIRVIKDMDNEVTQ